MPGCPSPACPGAGAARHRRRSVFREADRRLWQRRAGHPRRLGRTARERRLGDALGTSILTGIGFTMSLFIGTLAFGESDVEAVMRLGVLVGSALSAIVGAGVLAFLPYGRKER